MAGGVNTARRLGANPSPLTGGPAKPGRVGEIRARKAKKKGAAFKEEMTLVLAKARTLLGT